MIQSVNPSAPVADTAIAPREAVILAPGERPRQSDGPHQRRIQGRRCRNRIAILVNLSIPGEFESHMPDIAQWFLENPPRNAGT